MSRLTRISTKKSSFIPTRKFSPPPVLQPKAEIEPDAKLPEWKPGGGGAVSPLQRLLDSKAVQAKLTIGQPGDRYEQEADRVARDVVQRINSPVSETPQPENSVQRETEPEAEKLQMKPMLQRVHAVGGEDASQDLESSINRARGSGQPLDPGLQRSMGQAMGADFSGVRVHTDAQSDQLNQSIQAKAFTTGQDVFFRQGAYQPGSRGGQELIAHELTHVVQQNTGTVQRQSTNDQGWKSPALQMRSHLRNSSLSSLVIQRKVETWGGEWFDDTYTVSQSGSRRQAEMKMRFKPKPVVDAELIGLTQTTKAIHNKNPFYINSDNFYKGRAIQSGDAITTNAVTGETDEGTQIDQAKHNRNPLYAVEGAPATDTGLSDTLPSPGDVTKGNPWGKHGFRYTDSSGNLKEQDALLNDTPGISSVDVSKNSGQIFETTALAIKGNQEGTYYGSVRWGWRTDDAGNLNKIPFAKVSDGVPSSTFMKAAEIWNPGKSTGAENVDLPIVDVKVTTAPVTLSPPIPMQTIALPIGTRLQIIQEWHPPLLNGTVKVVDGPHTGITGEVSYQDWGNITDERP